jgi:hypothetical protein
MTEISILIPHKHDRENDKALKIALDCLIDNTDHDYEIIIDSTTPGDPYMGPHWDTPLLAAADNDAIITGVLVEAGAIGVAQQNIQANFGMTPEAFNRPAFEQFCAQANWAIDGDGWYFPCLINRGHFLQMGMFDTSEGGFPLPLDIRFWERWKAAGNRVQRVASYAYHLQNWSNPEEQVKAVRHG